MKNKLGRLDDGSSGARRVAIVGAGAFGLGCALELRTRGYRVSVYDAGPIPHPRASSNDISKLIRMDYGDDDFYSHLAAEAIDGWHDWNRLAGRQLYRETGFLVLAKESLRPGGFEQESLDQMASMGHPTERMLGPTLSERFPRWHAAGYVDGYLSERAGWVSSRDALVWLAERARGVGVTLHADTPIEAVEVRGGRVQGITAGATLHEADIVVVAGGAWTPWLVPHLGEVMWATGQPVVHFRVEDPGRYQPPNFLPWAADIQRTGWYGFSATDDGLLKVGHHGRGRRITPGDTLEVTQTELDRCRSFISRTFPELVDAPVATTRLCPYCDTFDSDFWVARDPKIEGLTVVAGGSGHGFKFAPLIGALGADAVEGKRNSSSERFRWRTLTDLRFEMARYSG